MKAGVQDPSVAVAEEIPSFIPTSSPPSAPPTPPPPPAVEVAPQLPSESLDVPPFDEVVFEEVFEVVGTVSTSNNPALNMAPMSIPNT